MVHWSFDYTLFYFCVSNEYFWGLQSLCSGSTNHCNINVTLVAMQQRKEVHLISQGSPGTIKQPEIVRLWFRAILRVTFMILSHSNEYYFVTLFYAHWQMLSDLLTLVKGIFTNYLCQQWAMLRVTRTSGGKLTLRIYLLLWYFIVTLIFALSSEILKIFASSISRMAWNTLSLPQWWLWAIGE